VLAQFHNFSKKVGTCHLCSELYARRGAKYKHIKSSPDVFRQLRGGLHRSATLRQVHSFAVGPGRYLVKQVTLCKGPSDFRVRSYAGRGTLGVDFFE
jgi:hypothetical protein